MFYNSKTYSEQLMWIPSYQRLVNNIKIVLSYFTCFNVLLTFDIIDLFTLDLYAIDT